MGFVALIAIIGLYEFYRGIKTFGHQPMWVPGYLVMIIMFFTGSEWSNEALLIAVLLLTLTFMVLLYPRYHIIDLAASFFGAVYVGLFIGYIWKLALVPDHFRVIVFALLLTWASDTGAYFVGTWFGKHKMIPSLSPNKTWEGFIGGFMATILVALAGGFLSALSPFQSIMLGIIVGLAAPVGDLFASGVKRGLGIKDFGNLIPGHGGILDRVDSLMCVAPVVYFLILKGGV